MAARHVAPQALACMQADEVWASQVRAFQVWAPGARQSHGSALRRSAGQCLRAVCRPALPSPPLACLTTAYALLSLLNPRGVL
eukprot:195529-Chlamydomonas_euryale.AAC.9